MPIDEKSGLNVRKEGVLGPDRYHTGPYHISFSRVETYPGMSHKVRKGAEINFQCSHFLGNSFHTPFHGLGHTLKCPREKGNIVRHALLTLEKSRSHPR